MGPLKCEWLVQTSNVSFKEMGGLEARVGTVRSRSTRSATGWTRSSERKEGAALSSSRALTRWKACPLRRQHPGSGSLSGRHSSPHVDSLLD